jgi:hypothetical protein
MGDLLTIPLCQLISLFGYVKNSLDEVYDMTGGMGSI